jgi:hypothetical protein
MPFRRERRGEMECEGSIWLNSLSLLLSLLL